MPGGEKLRKAKLRGVASEGMILSVSELEIGEDADGILVLEDGLAAGDAAGRGAAAGRAGAGDRGDPEPGRLLRRLRRRPRGPRDLRRRRSRAEPWAEDAAAEGEGEVDDFASVAVEVPELCPRFTARVFTDVTVGPSPLWLQARLAAAGQRPINNVVDITNYVMLLTAQPLHAFDLDKVPGGALTVRTAERGREDDDPRRRRAQPRRRDGAGLRPATAPPGSPGSWAARSPRSPPRRPGSCSRSRTGTGPTSSAPRASSACARRPPRASRSSCTRTSACGRSGSPRGCWSSSAAPSWCRGRSTSPPRSPAAAADRPARRAGRGPAGDGDLPGRPDRLPGAARLRRRGRRRGPRGRRCRPTATTTSPARST